MVKSPVSHEDVSVDVVKFIPQVYSKVTNKKLDKVLVGTFDEISFSRKTLSGLKIILSQLLFGQDTKFVQLGFKVKLG